MIDANKDKQSERDNEDAKNWNKYLEDNNFDKSDGDEYMRCINDKQIVERLKKEIEGLQEPLSDKWHSFEVLQLLEDIMVEKK